MALYSAVLYGRDKAWRWTGIAAISDSVLFGCKIFAAQTGYRSIFSMLTHSRPAYSLATTPAAFASAIMFMVISLALCISATAMARWDRSSGSNALVLQAREEALRAEQAKQRILAANMERDRISESIQSEVTMTLTSVIDQAVAGLRIRRTAVARGHLRGVRGHRITGPCGAGPHAQAAGRAARDRVQR